MRNNQTVVFGFLGTQLDGGYAQSRWQRWRPTVSLCAHESFPVSRLELLLMSEEDRPQAAVITADIQSVSPETTVVTHVLPIHDPWNVEAVYSALHDYAQGYSFHGSTDYFVHLATGTHVAQICLFALTESRHFPGKLVDTMPNGKKGDPDLWKGAVKVIDLDLAAYDMLSARFSQERQESTALLKSGIVTRNSAFNQMIGQVETVSLRSTAPILLTGPTGAGKTQLAQRIYELRSRRHLVSGPFVEVNCATLRGDNAMSALFGHKKGAFTGAIADREGLLRTANQGILLLDEVGEMPLEAQAMLLRALEDKRFTPIGSDKEVESDFVLIAGTNKDLAVEVQEGRFRADLLARLDTWAFQLPGLAERPEDIEPNLEHEMRVASGALGVNVSFNKSAREAYLAFAHRAPWPGNFRDFSSSVMRMATLADGGRITPEVVEGELGQLRRRWRLQLDVAIMAAPVITEAAVKPAFASSLFSAVMGERRVDLLDEVQLDVLFTAIRDTRSMAEAGRCLFAVSRAERASVNDSARVAALLKKWGLSYEGVKAAVTRA